MMLEMRNILKRRLQARSMSVAALIFVATSVWGIDPPAIQSVKLTGAPQLSPSIAQAINPNGVLFYTYWGDRKMRIFEVFPALAVEAHAKPLPSDSPLYSNLQQGTFIGVIRLLASANDDYRQDSNYQRLRPGYYTMRYGVAGDLDDDNPGEQEEVVFLTPVANDRSPGRIADDDRLIALSRKASQTQKPAVMNIAPVDENRKEPRVLRNDDSGASVLQLRIPNKSMHAAKPSLVPVAITLVNTGPGDEE
jgi:hypothetical protein